MAFMPAAARSGAAGSPPGGATCLPAEAAVAARAGADDHGVPAVFEATPLSARRVRRALPLALAACLGAAGLLLAACGEGHAQAASAGAGAAASGASGAVGPASGGAAPATGGAPGGAPGGSPGMGPGGKPAGPPVGVITVATASVAVETELPGRLEAWRVAQVRARVPGIVTKRAFTEGSEVRQGQLLFQLDDAAYRTALAAAQAAQARAEANLALAQATQQRNEPLAAAKAISDAEWVSTQTAVKLAEADLASTKAAVATARLNLDYAAVTAPLAGRIGRALVNEGALVGQGEATQLALIQQIHPLYVNFNLAAAEVMKLRSGARGGAGLPVQVSTEDGKPYAQPGRLLFSDLSVDPGTGQVLVRAELPNPQRLLLPGLYVKVRLALGKVEGAVALPQQAVTRSPAGDSVLVIGEGNVPQQRMVTVAGERRGPQGGQWVLSAGLAAGERVVVDGFQKIRPKAPVTPVPWTPVGAAKPGAGPGAGQGAGPAGAGAAAPAASR